MKWCCLGAIHYDCLPLCMCLHRGGRCKIGVVEPLDPTCASHRARIQEDLRFLQDTFLSTEESMSRWGEESFGVSQFKTAERHRSVSSKRRHLCVFLCGVHQSSTPCWRFLLVNRRSTQNKSYVCTFCSIFVFAAISADIKSPLIKIAPIRWSTKSLAVLGARFTSSSAPSSRHRSFYSNPRLGLFPLRQCPSLWVCFQSTPGSTGLHWQQSGSRQRYTAHVAGRRHHSTLEVSAAWPLANAAAITTKHLSGRSPLRALLVV